MASGEHLAYHSPGSLSELWALSCSSPGLTGLLSFLRTNSDLPGAQDWLERAVSFSDQKVPGKLKRRILYIPLSLYPTPPVGGATYGLPPSELFFRSRK